MKELKPIKSVAIVGAGAAGAVSAAALAREEYFEYIRVFERRGTAGGTWIYDPDPYPHPKLSPGSLPPDIDPALPIPKSLPTTTSPNRQERFLKTPIYDSLTTNVPDIAMSFSDSRFAYGPFAPHYIPRQYIENYISIHKLDPLLVVNTTVEDVSKLPSPRGKEKWKLTLRRHDVERQVDEWWEEEFDAVILANGHYSVPYVPEVKGLPEYITGFPGRVTHSKSYRSPSICRDRKVLVIGNSASGHDITAELARNIKPPVYQSRRSPSRWDGDAPPQGIKWLPVIKEYLPSGRVVFEDDSFIDDLDSIIYCTGYKASFPFWNEKSNGRPIWDYRENKLVRNYWHTFFQDFPTLGIVGVPRVLTFRSFEYQAVALARIFAGRNAFPLPPVAEQEKWEKDRLDLVKKEKRKYHDIQWETGETEEWLDFLFRLAGLATLHGHGRTPPALTSEMIWAIEHIKKYPEPGNDEGQARTCTRGDEMAEWVVINKAPQKDLLYFI